MTAFAYTLKALRAENEKLTKINKALITRAEVDRNHIEKLLAGVQHQTNEKK